MSAFRRLSRQLGLSGHNDDVNNEKSPSAPVHFLSLPIPQLNITPASPIISRESDYLPFSIDEHDHRPHPEKDQQDQHPSTAKHEPDYFANPSYDDVPLSSTSPGSPTPSSDSTVVSNTTREERRKSFPRYLHPEDLPPLHPPPPSNDRKRKRKLLCIRLFLLLSIIGLAIGLGVGLSRPNKPETSTTNVRGVAPPQMSGATQERTVNTAPAWTKLATSSSSSIDSAPPSSSTRLALPPKGGGGVQLHQGEIATHGAKNAQKQRRKLRQFGTGTVAGWR